MDIDKVLKLRFNVRPLRWCINALAIALFLGVVAYPVAMGHLPPPPPVKILSPIEQTQMAQISFIETEIMSRPGTVANFPARVVATTLVHEAHKARLDPLFVLAVVEAESNFVIDARSHANAKGLMQILPSTFAAMNPTGNIFDPAENIRAGTRLLGLLMGSFHRPESILMAYNGGPSRTAKYLNAQAVGEDYPISEEMRTYPRKVMSKYKRLLAKAGHRPTDAHKLFKVPNKPVSRPSIGKQP
jgi:hypothetical protein